MVVSIREIIIFSNSLTNCDERKAEKKNKTLPLQNHRFPKIYVFTGILVQFKNFFN
jgi:hypothetical protein